MVMWNFICFHLIVVVKIRHIKRDLSKALLQNINHKYFPPHGKPENILVSFQNQFSHLARTHFWELYEQNIFYTFGEKSVIYPKFIKIQISTNVTVLVLQMKTIIHLI